MGHCTVCSHERPHREHLYWPQEGRQRGGNEREGRREGAVWGTGEERREGKDGRTGRREIGRGTGRRGRKGGSGMENGAEGTVEEGGAWGLGKRVGE